MQVGCMRRTFELLGRQEQLLVQHVGRQVVVQQGPLYVVHLCKRPHAMCGSVPHNSFALVTGHVTGAVQAIIYTHGQDLSAAYVTVVLACTEQDSACPPRLAP